MTGNLTADPTASGATLSALRGSAEPLPTIDAAGIATAALATPAVATGDGSDILLLHGPGENALGWVDTIDRLAATHRVIAPDLPGHGESAPAGDLDADRVLRWLGDVIAATCESPPIVVGRTLGGAIAARFCAAHPDGVRRLVLVDTLGLVPFDPAPPFGAALHRFMAEPSVVTHARLMEYCAYDFDALRQRLGDRWDAIAGYTVERVREIDRLASIGGLMAQFGLPAIPRDELARVTTATSLIWGRHDLATPLAAAESASGTFGWPLQVVEDAGDDPALEQPDAFVAALRHAIEPTE